MHIQQYKFQILMLSINKMDFTNVFLAKGITKYGKILTRTSSNKNFSIKSKSETIIS
jgi:hypothetical protein